MMVTFLKKKSLPQKEASTSKESQSSVLQFNSRHTLILQTVPGKSEIEGLASGFPNLAFLKKEKATGQETPRVF